MFDKKNNNKLHEEHYADIGGSYYLYVPDYISHIQTTYSGSFYHRIGDDSMNGFKSRGNP